ncbi:glycosyltransferase [Fictibacillus sp. KIGAM418]|uniref:Glycosyltransferase n=1 Tax=Fictibacillus marinisediminis TaxID=2878389 RepID=A0A9X2BEJ8_9BACL|nr:glycosyltransferase family 2 protein [Fictibacillus marinisediminis]MCK6258716.1 glycosyltransferase [Fictibacillus marinisediminis]
MSSPFRQTAREILQSDKIEIVNHPSRRLAKWFGRKKKITVVTAAYNVETFIQKTVDSVIHQTMDFDDIEYIIVDDCSTDKTKEILHQYVSKHKNICVVSLKENTGTPGTPRNIGIELATGTYITFLDGDDWLEPDGLETLVNILEETGDDYAVGKTIKVTSDSETVIGEHESVKERRSITPYEIPRMFYHMGPRARAVKLDLLKEHDIGFPDMKFGEDKQFFCDVFFHADTISTTTKPVFYVNRTDENPGSLTKVTSVLDKRRCDLKVIQHIKAQNLPVEKERAALTRLYEIDMFKTFDSQVFVKSDQKEAFVDVLREAMAMAKDLRYDIRETFQVPLYRAAADLFLEDRIDDFISLFTWLKREKNKKYVIKEGLPYFELPFLKDKYQHIRIPMLARAIDSYTENEEYVQTFEIYGDYLANVNTVLIRDRKNYINEIQADFKISGNKGEFRIPYEKLNELKTAFFTVFIRYNDYELINIKRILKNEINYKDRKFDFYSTKANNIGLKITE